MRRISWRVLAAALTWMAVVLWPAEAAPPTFDLPDSPHAETVHRLSPRVVVVTARNPGHNNVTAIAGQRGVVVVDTATSPGMAVGLRTIIETELERTDLVYTINTHHHMDHVFGNQAFADTVIISHQLARERLSGKDFSTGHPASWMPEVAADRRKQASGLEPDSPRARRLGWEADWFDRTYAEMATGFELPLPTITFTDRMQVDLGGLTVRLYHYGHADTDNSVIVHVPEEGIVVSGDLYWFGGMFSSFDETAEPDVPRWIDVLDKILDDPRPVRWMICGHRGVWPGEYLTLRRDYIVALWSAVSELSSAGLSLDEALDKLPIDDFPQMRMMGFTEALDAEGLDDEEYELENQHRENVRVFWRSAEGS